MDEIPQTKPVEQMPNTPPRLSLRPISLALTLIFGILLGAGGMVAYQELQTSPAVPPTPTATQPAPTPTAASPATAVVSNTPTPTVSAIYLRYNRPDAWRLWSSTDGTFSFAYNGSAYSDPTGDISGTLGLNSLKCCSSIFFSNAAYDGGSGHALLLSATQYAKTPKTTEKTYIIGGKPSLFLYHVDASSICSVGAVFTGGSQALIVTSLMCSPADLEPILSTFTFAK